MRTRQIIITDEAVTKFKNRGAVAGRDLNPDKLLEIETPRGTTYTFVNPSPIIAKFYDDAGNEIPYNSTLSLYKRANGRDAGKFLVQFPYSNYFGISEGDQRNVKFAAQITQQLGDVDVAGVRNPQEHVLELWIDTEVKVNLDDPRTRFEITVIEQN